MNDETRARQLLEFSLLAKDDEWLAKLVDAFGEVRREEREACAKVAALHADDMDMTPSIAVAATAACIAKAIRARKP